MCWPEMGWRRAARYWMLRLQRITASSEQIASGVATGITVSFVPVLGVHVLMAVAIAALTGGHVAAAAIASLAVLPLFLPLVFGLDFMLGRAVLSLFGYGHAGAVHDIDTMAVHGPSLMTEHFLAFFLPASVGAVIIMTCVWPCMYVLMRSILKTYKQVRR